MVDETRFFFDLKRHFTDIYDADNLRICMEYVNFTESIKDNQGRDILDYISPEDKQLVFDRFVKFHYIKDVEDVSEFIEKKFKEYNEEEEIQVIIYGENGRRNFTKVKEDITVKIYATLVYLGEYEPDKIKKFYIKEAKRFNTLIGSLIILQAKYDGFWMLPCIKMLCAKMYECFIQRYREYCDVNMYLDNLELYKMFGINVNF